MKPFFRTLLFHGLESDWLEEECDDDVFRDQKIHIILFRVQSDLDLMVNLLMLRKDVLEQKVNQVLDSVGYSNRGLVYTVLKSSVSSSSWL